MVAFGKWLQAQPAGTTIGLCRDTRLALRTIYNARDGRPVRYRTAKILSEATNGAVSIAELCDPQPARKRSR